MWIPRPPRVASGATSGLAPLNSPAFTGNPTAPTQTAGNNSQRLATTALVPTGIAGVNGGGGSLSIPGPYDTDAAAASGGVAVVSAQPGARTDWPCRVVRMA